MDMSLSKLQELVIDMEAWCAQSMGSQGVRHDSATELNWTERDHAGSHQVCKYPFCGGMSHVGPRPGRCMEENFMSLLTDTGEGNGNPLQYSCLENPMGGGAWWAAVHGVVKSRTWLRDFTFTFHFHALEKEMATHSSILAWRIPGTEEPSGLLSMGSHRVGHDWSDLAAAAAAAGLKRKGVVIFVPACLWMREQKASQLRSIIWALQNEKVIWMYYSKGSLLLGFGIPPLAADLWSLMNIRRKKPQGKSPRDMQ